MRHLHVVCAIIERDGKILATQRSEFMSLPLKWEFPGGKIREGENPLECLRRELLEELGIEVAVDRALTPVTHSYPDFMVTLYPFVCTGIQGKIILYEHAGSRWLRPEDLATLDWAEADWPIIANYRRHLNARVTNGG